MPIYIHEHNGINTCNAVIHYSAAAFTLQQKKKSKKKSPLYQTTNVMKIRFLKSRNEFLLFLLHTEYLRFAEGKMN